MLANPIDTSSFSSWLHVAQAVQPLMLGVVHELGLPCRKLADKVLLALIHLCDHKADFSATAQFMQALIDRGGQKLLEPSSY